MGTWAKRLVDNWPIAFVVAAVLALAPVINWLGIALAVMLVLRHGSVLITAAYFIVGFLAYYAFGGYSFALIGKDISGVLVMFVPLWVMAVLLRQWRSLSIALVAGTFTMMFLVLSFNLMNGISTFDEWLVFFDYRVEAAGVSQADVLAATSGQSFEQAARMIMLGWPFALMTMEIGVLFLARWGQARLYYPGGFRHDFHALRLPKWVALVMGALLLATSFATIDMVLLIHVGLLAMALLAIAGLGFIHWYVAFKRYNPLWLVGVYGLIIGTSMAVLPLLAVVALLDSGLNFRQRLTAAN